MIIEREFAEQGRPIRRPATFRAWLAACAAATATTASYASILDAATPGDIDNPSRATTIAYRDVLSRLWLLDPIPGWLPAGGSLARLAQAPKHHLGQTPALPPASSGSTRRHSLLVSNRALSADWRPVNPLWAGFLRLW